MMTTKLRHIRLEYEDGSFVDIDNYFLQKLEQANEAISLLERARTLYQSLRPMMETKKDK